MKKTLVSLLAVLVLISCKAKPNTFEVTVNAGEVEITETSAVAITYKAKVGDKDSTFTFKAPFVEGVATVTGCVEDNDVYQAYLYLLDNIEDEVNKPFGLFFLENTNYNITLVDNKRNPLIVEGGGELQQETNFRQNAWIEIYEKSGYFNLVDSFMKDQSNTQLMDTLEAMDKVLGPKIEKVREDFIASHPNSILDLSDACNNRYFISLDSLRKVIANYEADGKYVNTHFFKTLKETELERGALSVGAQAPDFTLNDPNGNPITLSEFYAKNKITMIDFWASWCGPCRRFNPTLTQIYAKYHAKGLGIIGVSLDREKDEWTKAIAKDKLVWSHVSDLAFWDCAAAKLYQIKYIPQSYFVDSTGKILLVAPEEEEIEKFLEENL